MALPQPVTNLTVALNSAKTAVTVSWKNNTSVEYSGIVVLRSSSPQRMTSVRVFTQLAILKKNATSYVDLSISDDDIYQYRVQPFTDSGSVDTNSVFVYTTPAAPTDIKAVKTSASSAIISWNNSSRISINTEVQRSINNGSWTTIATTGLGVTSYTDNDTPSGALGGYWRYRVRNTTGSLASVWTAASNMIKAITVPAAPTLTDKPAPVVPSDIETQTVSWVFNSLDGSEQSTAELEITKATTTTVTVTGNITNYDIDLTDVSDGDQVSVRVRTKGLHVDFSDWSELYTFTVKNAPQVTITNPAIDSGIEENIPIIVEWDYVDAAPCAEWVLQLYKGERLVHTAQGVEETSYSLDEDTYIPENETDYSFILFVRSGSSLTNSAVRTFSVEYIPPAIPTLEASIDEETGSVLLTPFVGEDAVAPETESLSIARVDGDEVTTIATGLSDGSTVIDYLPILNSENTYQVTAQTSNGLTATLTIEVDVQVGPWFFWNFGEAFSQVARLKGNPNWSHNYSTDQELFQMAGREYPVLMSGKLKTEQIEFSGTARTDDHRAQLDALALWARRVVYREPHGVKKTVRTQVSSSESGGPRRTEYSIKMDVVS